MYLVITWNTGFTLHGFIKLFKGLLAPFFKMSIVMKAKILLITVAVIVLQSCATILDGSRNKTHVKNGIPPNAKVYYNGNYVGQAPVNVKVNKQCKKGECYIEIKYPGYVSQKISLTRKVSVGFTILDIISGVIPLGIDFITGNIYKPRPNKIHINT